MRALLTSPGTGDQGEAVEFFRTDEREPKPSFRTRRHGMRKSDGLLGQESDIQRAS